MKIIKLVIPLLLLIVAACSSNTNKEDLLIIDVNKNHSKIILNLQDIADVEYIKLANDSNFLVRSRPLVFSENYILTKGGKEGEILFFNHQGQPLQKFCHYGNGPHEYNYITNLRIDEERKEVYVHDVFSKKILVYNLTGNFIREFSSGDGRFIYNFNKNTFLFYNTETNTVNPDLKPYFSLVSKEDGAIMKRIEVPMVSGKRHDLAITKIVKGGNFTYTAMHLPLARYKDGYILNELSSDTIYKYTFGETLSPFIVRTPSVNDIPVYLEEGVETSKYIFMVRIAINEKDEQNMFPKTNWVYDKDKKNIYEYNIVNKDFPEIQLALDAHMLNLDIEPGYGLSRFNSGQLIEAFKNGKLQGKLKDIASTLNEEDNDVLMLLKFK